MILEYNVFFSHLAFFSSLRKNSEVLPDSFYFHGQDEYKEERKRMDNKEKNEWRERDKEVRFLQRWFTKFIGGYIILLLLSLSVFTPLLNILSLTMGDFEFGSSLISNVSFDAHPSLGGHTPFKEENPNGFDITPIVSPSLSSLSSMYSPTSISSLQGGLFKSTIEMNRIEYCTRSRLLENSDHAYFAIFLASKYINNNNASLYPLNTISMGFIRGKNLAQQFPSRTQRTKSTNFSTTLDYVCIPEQENKWFEHRWKIESDNGGSYYLCVDVPGPGIKRKRTVKVAEKNKTQKIFHETQSPNPFSFTWCPVSPVSSPSLSPTPSRSSSFSSISSISSPPSVVPCSPTASISPLSSPFVSTSPIIPSSVSSLSPAAPYMEFLPCSVPALTSVQELNLFLTSLCND